MYRSSIRESLKFGVQVDISIGEVAVIATAGTHISRIPPSAGAR